MSTVKTVMADATARLAAAGIENALFDARLLCAEVLGQQPGYLITHPEEPLDEEALARFEAMIARREQREPVSHILGAWEFWGLEFKVTKDTLTPRPDSEVLVQTVLDLFPGKDAEFSILDLGTGTGCLLLSVLNERPKAHGVGIDISPEAVAVATENAKALGLSDRVAIREGNWAHEVGKGFNVIISNPPYIPEADLVGLEPEVVRYEPKLALSPGADGLEAYHALAVEADFRLDAGDYVVLEVGIGQAAEVAELLRTWNFTDIQVFTDLGGVERCIRATRA